jgi:transcriptional regulator with XRE-family HTH domain
LIKSFGLVVRAHREANSISQERLAELAGLDRTYVGCIERGERNLGISNVAVLASALGVSAAQLLREAEELEKQEQPPGR